MRERPRRFSFYQLVRLLERLYPDHPEVGTARDPDQEAVRFRSIISLRSAVSEVEAVDFEVPVPGEPPRKGGSPRAHVDVTFMGMASPSSFGSLPTPYAVQILEEARDKRHHLRDFFDLFNHRFISLFYRAHKKSRLPLLAEAKHERFFERALLALIGLGTDGLSNRLPLHDTALLARSGLLARSPAPAASIEALIASYFGAKAEVEPFVPVWCKIDVEDQTRLGWRESRLGDEAFIGERVLLFATKFRIRIGPLGRVAYEDLLPDRPGYHALSRLVRLAAGPNQDYELQLVLRAEEVPPLVLERDPELPPRLGGSTWLGTRTKTTDADDAVLFGARDLVPSVARDYRSAA